MILLARGLWRIVSHSWQMLIGVLLGLVAYVYTFLFHGDYYNWLQKEAGVFVDYIETSWQLTSDTTKWITLLQIDDKLVFMLYVVGARFLLFFVEEIFIAAPFRWAMKKWRNKHGDGEQQSA